MRTNIILFTLISIILCSCAAPGYLPSSDSIAVNQYGSHITVSQKNAASIKGELIALDSNRIVVLSESTNKCFSVPIDNVRYFKLSYAKPKHYGWSIPVYTLATISHGMFLIFSAPVNLIVTISVTVAGERAYSYSDENMTYNRLKMFARFPQGIPPDIELASIE